MSMKSAAPSLVSTMTSGSRERTTVMVGADEGLWLQLVNQPIGAIELPRRLGTIPPAVEPDAANLAVIGQQLAKLAVHVLDVARPLALLRALGVATGAAAGKVIGMMPVEL